MITTMEFTDGYKLDHRRQYPEGTEFVYSNWTPEYDGYGGIYEHGWNSNPDVNREVVTFRASGLAG